MVRQPLSKVHGSQAVSFDGVEDHISFRQEKSLEEPRIMFDILLENRSSTHKIANSVSERERLPLLFPDRTDAPRQKSAVSG